jgi:hypothetical protein
VNDVIKLISEVRKMFIMSTRKIAREKVQLIQNGFSAFADSQEVASLIKKELDSLNLKVYEDVTDKGYWFIPENH